MAVNSRRRSHIIRNGRYIVKRIKLTDGGPANPSLGTSMSAKTLDFGGAPGIIKGILVDFTSTNASGVVIIKENNSSGATLFTINGGDTDSTNASTGEMLAPCTDGLTVTNTTSADVPGLYFSSGLYLSYASATVGDTVVIKMLVDVGVRYIKRTINCVGTNGNALGSYAFYSDRPGMLRAIRVAASAASTADLTIKVDNDVAGGAGGAGTNAGATVFTATNFGTTAIGSAAGTGCAATLINGGIDEAGGAVTVGMGIPFMHGFTTALAQCNSAEAIVAEFWIET